MKKSGHRVEKRLLLDIHEVSGLVTARKPGAELVNHMFHIGESRISAIGNWLHRLRWRSWLGWHGLLVIVFSIDKSMTGGSSLDFTQAHKVTSLEVAISMLELPHCLLRASVVENIAHCAFVSLVP